MSLANLYQKFLNVIRHADFLAPLALRLYLAPVFWVSGMNKVYGFQGTVAWFGNPDRGLGLPLPTVMAYLATATEVAGALLLLFGFGTRLISIPLIFTMLVAIFKVHWVNGWQAIADPMSAFASGHLGPFQFEDAAAAIDRLGKIRSLLKEHGNYSWLTGEGSVGILNNGIEFAATYLVMLLALLYLGGGRFVSVDYWLGRRSAKTSG